MEIINRGRRLRENKEIRSLVRETRISKDSLIYPIFIDENIKGKEEIPSMPNQYRYSLDAVNKKMEDLLSKGVNKIMLFGIPKTKDSYGSMAYASDGIVQKALRQISENYKEMYLVTDVCMCEYTSHGHCGIIHNHKVNNDETLKYLENIALSHVQAGSKMIAPSDMMDGRIKAIRKILDKNNYENIPIMSYSAKYASAFYGPFRDAANSAPSFGDRKSYQMDYHNFKEGIKEVFYDIDEGADIVMVKPCMNYLDLIREISTKVNVPVAAYSVSGEYAMVKAGARLGFVNEEKIIGEMAVGAFRSGASIYISYFAEDIARQITKGLIG